MVLVEANDILNNNWAKPSGYSHMIEYSALLGCLYNTP
jgi:hypothetical protein